MKLTKEEIEFVVNGYTKGDIPDYQMSALLMAICINNMDEEETFNLTTAMKESGNIVNLKEIEGIKVDKHSTGGVGDKTTLIVGPLAAALGIKVAKMSGRGLGFTGGTIDKMEAIPGMKTSLLEKEFFENVNNIGISVIGQTGEIAVADKKIYALRDVTGTVSNLSLIASSIMSKKLAAGSDKILLDVKCGNGAFMKTQEEAVELAKEMVKLGNKDEKETWAVITDMNQPLGYAVGNSLEVIEAIETLKGKGPKDITELSLVITGIMAFLGGKASSIEEGKKIAEKSLYEGKGLDKLKEMIKGQGGNEGVIDNYQLFPTATYSKKIISTKEGYVNEIITEEIGRCAQLLGAGREKKEDVIDLGAGIVTRIKIGDLVKPGDHIATFYTSKERVIDEIEELFFKSIITSNVKTSTPLLIKEVVY